MACEMIYIVQPFSVGDAGELVAEMPIPARSEPEARDQARWMAARYPGVVAFACSGDFDRGEYNGSRILAKHGAIPPEVA